MYLRLNEEHVCTDSYQSDEPYGDWSSEYDFTPPTEAYLTDKNGYGDFPYIGPDLVAPQEIYAIYAVWSSGDSFGSDSRGSYEIIIVNADRDRAERNLAKLQASDKFGTVILENDDGTTIQQYTGAWQGYFESLDELAIAPVMFLGRSN